MSWSFTTREPFLSIALLWTNGFDRCTVSEYQTDIGWEYIYQAIDVKNSKNLLKVDHKLTYDEIQEYYQQWSEINKMRGYSMQ